MAYYILANQSYSYSSKKSKFHALSYFVKNIEEINSILSLLKDKYPDASHFPYAYIIGEYEYCSDDKEPKNSAGKQILNCLKSNNINSILIVVVRYFGGIELGYRNLAKTFYKVTNELISNTQKYQKILKYSYTITFEYPSEPLINKKISSYVIKRNYNKNITYELLLDSQQIINEIKYLLISYKFNSQEEEYQKIN